MKKQHVLTVTTADIFKYLRDQGIEVPAHASADWHGDSISFTWDEALGENIVSRYDFERAKEFVQANDWIGAIKYIRSQYDWGLKESKDYYEKFLARFRPA